MLWLRTLTCRYSGDSRPLLDGNAAEWTANVDLPYPFHADDPRHADVTTRKIARGDSWNDRVDLAPSGCRASYWPWHRIFDVGFRVICEADEPKTLARTQ